MLSFIGAIVLAIILVVIGFFIGIFALTFATYQRAGEEFCRSWLELIDNDKVRSKKVR